METVIERRLWNTISSSYRAGHYTHAIRDAMSLLTQVIRDKSGLDGDGHDLVGGAFGYSQKKGTPPRIAITKLQTQTERDMQQGMRSLLDGMYKFIRNPRSHEMMEDSKESADAIIIFIGYLLAIIDASQASYSVQDFIAMVEDAHFVNDPNYIKGLVDRVPKRKLSDTLLELYRSKEWKSRYHLKQRAVIGEIVDRLGEAGLKDLLSSVSEELLHAADASAVTLTISVLEDVGRAAKTGPNWWARLDLVPRVRAEHILMKELAEATYDAVCDRETNPAASWVDNVVPDFQCRDDLVEIVIDKLRNHKDFRHANYLAKRGWFRFIPALVPEDHRRFHDAVGALLRPVDAGNEYYKNKLVAWLRSYGCPTTWASAIVERATDLTDPYDPEAMICVKRTCKGTCDEKQPFLGKFRASETQNAADPDYAPSLDFTEYTDLPF